MKITARYLLFACLPLSFMTSGCQRQRDTDIVGVVGRYQITRKQMEYRNQIIRIHYPNDNRKLGLEQLIKSYTNAEILNNNGHRITSEILESEDERIKKTTTMPDRLEKIKAIFGKDRENYLQVYVLPVYADRVIYFEFFPREPKIHEKSKATAESFLKEAAQARDFKAFVEKQGRKVSILTLSEQEGFDWGSSTRKPASDKDNDKGNKRGKSARFLDKSPMAAQREKIFEQMKLAQKTTSQEEAKRWIQEIALPLKPGQIYPKVIDHHQFWLVARLKQGNPKKKTYSFETVSLPKEEYGKWFESEKKKIRIERKI